MIGKKAKDVGHAMPVSAGRELKLAGNAAHRSPGLHRDRILAGIERLGAELRFNPQKLVVLRGTVRARQ